MTAGSAVAVAVVGAGALWTVTVGSIIVLAIAVPMVIRVIHRRFDVFEPIVWANVALLGMFVIRPVALWAADSYAFRGYDIRPTVDLALLVAALGVVSFQVGYAWPIGKRLANWLPSSPTTLHPSSALSSALLLVAIGVSGFVILPPGAGFTTSAYLYYLPMLVIPGTLLLLGLGLTRRNVLAVIISVAATALAVGFLSASGQRAWVLVLLGPALVYGAYLRRRARPAPMTMVLLIVALVPFITAARDLRPDQSIDDLLAALGQAVFNVPEGVRHLMLGADSEMFDALSLELQAVPAQLGFRPGYTIVSILTQPIPRALWVDKPRGADDLLNEWFFGGVGYQAGDAGPAYSLFGGLYFDASWIGVIAGGVVMGILCRVPWEWYRRSGASMVGELQLATALPLIVILLRGNVQDTLSRALFVVVPILVVGYVARSREGFGRSERGITDGSAVIRVANAIRPKGVRSSAS